MINRYSPGPLRFVALGLVLYAAAVHGQDRSRYRDYQLGGGLSAISTIAGVPASETKTLHSRPAMMQEFQWQRPYTASDAVQADPVKQIVFSFYNDQLSRMVVDYDRDRTAGLTDADLIDAISATYGPRLKPGVRTARGLPSQIEQESGTPIARWGDVDYSVALYRSTYAGVVRVVVISPKLEALARSAETQSTRMDEREAPQREVARQKQAADDARTAQEKARLANKAAFRP
jgi:hypothetical protein